MLFNWRALLAIGLAGLVAGCSRKAAEPQSLTIQFTADVDGRLVPCGCFTGQLGGLTRIATLFGPADGKDVLRMDVGDAIEGPADYQQIEHRYLLRAFAEMGYAAANIGHREAQLGVTKLRELRSHSTVPAAQRQSARCLNSSTHLRFTSNREAWQMADRHRWRARSKRNGRNPRPRLGD
jgi:2',3'-cyclic-nucleotide 2'-phosphodiesterase (5'-nucleotidase family)